MKEDNKNYLNKKVVVGKLIHRNKWPKFPEIQLRVEGNSCNLAE